MLQNSYRERLKHDLSGLIDTVALSDGTQQDVKVLITEVVKKSIEEETEKRETQ